MSINKKEISKYYYKKYKNAEMSEEEINNMLNQKAYKNFLGNSAYKEMISLNMDLKEYIDYITLKYNKKLEKLKYRSFQQKVRKKTNYFINKYCNIDKKCQICGKKAEIHHVDYNEYLLINLLCKKHHDKIHKDKKIKVPTLDLRKYAKCP